MTPQIAVHNLGKRYKRYPSYWARLAEWLTGGRYRRHDDRWAIRGVSFDVRAGEALGIVGQNGAGKSTLLKILTGTTRASEGEVRLAGRVAALLELGIGFHPDFSGRENARMVCKMAGLRGEEIQRLLPEIESFSELGDYMGQPLRVYSTGMQMRLAFSAATAVRPEILIIDEALAVGDIYFQHKCIGRIRDFKEEGTTLLFVSHDPGAVKSLCDRALLIDHGNLVMDSTPDAVLDYYNAMIARKSPEASIQQAEDQTGRVITRSGSGKARVVAVDVLNENGEPARIFRTGEKASIRFDILFNEAIQSPTFGFILRDRLGNNVFGTNTYHTRAHTYDFAVGDTAVVTFKLPLNLGCGHYAVSASVHSLATHLDENYDWYDQCLIFEIVPGGMSHFIGVAALPVEVNVERRPGT